MILVAEDDPLVQQLISKQLAKLGFVNRLIVPDGRSALEHAERCCVILMDVNMPEMDGLEATRTIRQRETDEGKLAIPIIAITGASDRNTCLSAGMSEYLQKPILLQDLQNVLQRWLPDNCDCCS